MRNIPALSSSATRTPGWHGYSVKWSPFDPNLAVCAANENYGIRGRGSLVVLRRPADGVPLSVSVGQQQIVYTDAFFDVSFSESDPRLVCAAAADGNIIFFNIISGELITLIRAHAREVSSIEWNPTRTDQFILSASWDGQVNLIDPERSAIVRSFQGHRGIVYSATWAPRLPGILCSTSSDGCVALWDVRSPVGSRPTLMFRASPTEVLSVDWSKYDCNTLATGSVDAAVSLWDIRHTSRSHQRFFHKKAVRKVCFSPFFGHVLASVSYDFTTQVHNLAANRVEVCLVNHTEFAYGLDWNTAKPGELIDCGWDQLVTVTTMPPDKMPCPLSSAI